MKRFSAFLFLLAFAVSHAQVSAFQKADSRYERKKKALYKKYPKPNNERTKQEWLLTEAKIATYENALKKISEEERKGLTDVPPPVGQKVSKEAEYEAGKAAFQKLLTEALDLSFLNFPASSYHTTLRFAVDAQGNAVQPKVKGNNEDVNTFIEAAFYKIKDKGKWKPAEENGKPVISAVVMSFDLKLNQ
ncbi:MAG: energy transducer TonB [Chryseobacterium sp.]|jgi:hypothetical protein|uniref:hypothetical protein n=1 Tax=Chryseobacterium sp. TaxID=1871047 RepID=UPI002825D150|nr:hypothetical protein [Chryseobacterium sp.]MDR2234739.1 energy transducer TonB [Chryseobacterium sp.]